MYALADSGVGAAGGARPPFEIPKRVFKRDRRCAPPPPFPQILDPPLVCTCLHAYIYKWTDNYRVSIFSDGGVLKWNILHPLWCLRVMIKNTSAPSPIVLHFPKLKTNILSWRKFVSIPDNALLLCKRHKHNNGIYTALNSRLYRQSTNNCYILYITNNYGCIFTARWLWWRRW